MRNNLNELAAFQRGCIIGSREGCLLFREIAIRVAEMRQL